MTAGRIQNKSEKIGNESNRKGNTFVTADRIQDKTEKVAIHPEKVGKIRKNPEMRKEQEGEQFLWRSDASGTSRKNRKNPEEPGNERNRKGNNFVPAGTIWIRSAKSGNDTNVKRNNCETGVRKKSGKSGKSGNCKDTTGIYQL